MEPLDTINLWIERVRDRARTISFGRFLWRRFLDDRLFQAAASLAYTTVFALVPLAIVVFGVLSAFPVFDRWSDTLSDYVFSNFVPNAARAAEGYLRQFSASAGQLTAAGFIALVVSLLITLNSVEETFNQIWRVSSTRPKLTRFLVYWTVLTLGAMLAAASLAVSARVFALPLFGTSEGRWLANVSLTVAPILIEFVCIMLVYRVVPHHTVKWRHAIPGAILAAIMLELVKWGMGAYLGSFQSYQKLYGTVAFVPILLLWIYLCWVSVLLGASLASSIAAFRYQPADLRLPVGYEIYGLLRLIGRFHQARADGRSLDQWAQWAGLSPRTLTRHFRDETTLSFAQWRQQARLAEGLRRLSDGQSVSDIAHELGFSSPSAFVTVFRRHFGSPPGRYLARSGHPLNPSRGLASPAASG